MGKRVLRFRGTLGNLYTVALQDVEQCTSGLQLRLILALRHVILLRTCMTLQSDLEPLFFSLNRTSSGVDM